MRFDRFGPNDTPEHIEERIIEMLRKKTPEERAQMLAERMEAGRILKQLQQSTDKRP